MEVETGGAVKRYVLRKKPPGELLQSAHAVEREFQVNFNLLKVYIFMFEFNSLSVKLRTWLLVTKSK